MKFSFSLLSLLVIAVGFVLSLSPLDTFAAFDAKSVLFVENGSNSAESSTDVNVQNNFLRVIQVYLLATYAIVAIGALIFIGFKLFTAKGDEGEFKKAWVALTYTIVGLVIAPLAYVVVRIVSGFTF